MSKSDVIKAYWDYKSGDEAFEKMKKELPKLGLYTYSSPNSEGSDGFGIIVSKTPLTDEQLEEYDETL
jgi:hypothetical protein